MVVSCIIDAMVDNLNGYSKSDLQYLFTFFNVDTLPELATAIITQKAEMSGVWETIPYLDEKFDIISTLGFGSFGIVYKAKSKEDGKTYAIKLLQRIDPNTKGEVYILSQLNHPNIVKYIKGFTILFHPEGYQYLIQMEYIDGEPMNKVRELIKPEIKSINLKLLKVLEYIHSKGIIHRDIKPENIMIRNESLEPVLIDFGLSCKLGVIEYGCKKANVGTPLYFSPSVLVNLTERKPLSPGEHKYRDIWALGFTIIDTIAPQIIKQYEIMAVARANQVIAKGIAKDPFILVVMRQMKNLQPGLIVNQLSKIVTYDPILLKMLQKMLVFLFEPTAAQLVKEFEKLMVKEFETVASASETVVSVSASATESVSESQSELEPVGGAAGTARN